MMSWNTPKGSVIETELAALLICSPEVCRHFPESAYHFLKKRWSEQTLAKLGKAVFAGAG
jgi:hypothetical protein